MRAKDLYKALDNVTRVHRFQLPNETGTQIMTKPAPEGRHILSVHNVGGRSFVHVLDDHSFGWNDPVPPEVIKEVCVALERHYKKTLSPAANDSHLQRWLKEYHLNSNIKTLNELRAHASSDT